MSHITNVRTKITDLESFAEAAEACGGTFDAEARQYRSFYGLKPCDGGTMRVPGSQYEVALMAAGDGSYTLQYDSWGGHGQALERAAGPGLDKLKREYAAVAAMRKAKQKLGPKGWRVQREDLAGGRIRLRLRKR